MKLKGFSASKALSNVKSVHRYGPTDQERALITAILTTGTLAEVITARVDGSWFSDDDNRRYYRWITEEFAKHGKPPTPQRFEAHFRGFVGVDAGDNISELVSALREKKFYQDLSVVVKDTTDAMRENPATAAAGMVDKVNAIVAKMSEAVFFPVKDSRHRLKERYEAVEASGGERGIPWPWPIMNVYAVGFLMKQFHVFYGKPGTMKTFLAIWLAAYFDALGIPVGFITLEMSDEEIEGRYAAQSAGLPYDAVERGKLDKRQKKRFFAALDRMEDSSVWVFEPTTSGDQLLQEIEARMLQRPEVLIWIIDGLGMAARDSSWEAFLDLAKSVKGLAKRRKRTVIAMHHTNQDLVKEGNENDANDVAGGSALHRYVDGLFRIRRSDAHRDDQESQIEAVKVRNGEDQLIFKIHAAPGVTFAEKSVIKQPKPREDIEDAADEDNESLQ